MNHLLSAELLKFRTTRTPYVAAALAGAFAALVPVLATADPHRFGVAPLTATSLTDLLRAPGHVVVIAALLVGIVAAAGEHTHRTILTTRLVEPDPTRLLAAKVVASAIIGAAIGTIAEIIALIVSGVGLRLNEVQLTPLQPVNIAAVITVTLAAALACVLGSALGALLRSTAAAIGLVVAWVFAIENIIPMLAGQTQTLAWLPAEAFDAILAPQAGTLTGGAAWTLLAAYTSALLALAATAATHRDV